MEIEYYPNYDEKTKLFLDPKSLDGLLVLESGVHQISLFSTGGVRMKLPVINPFNDFTKQSSKYYIIEVSKKKWNEIYDLVLFDSKVSAIENINFLEELVDFKSYIFYKESNDQYGRREIQLISS